MGIRLQLCDVQRRKEDKACSHGGKRETTSTVETVVQNDADAEVIDHEV